MIENKVKLVIWDLDETFWRGTLTEGGIAHIDSNIEMVRELSRLRADRASQALRQAGGGMQRPSVSPYINLLRGKMPPADWDGVWQLTDK